MGARWLQVIVTLLAGLAVLLSQAGNIAAIRGASEANVRRTNRFESSIRHLTSVAADHRSFPVIFYSDDPWDFEPLISYPRFLVAGGVTNALYLLWQPEHRETSDFLESLSGRLTDYSQAGLPGLYSPIADLGPQTQDCTW